VVIDYEKRLEELRAERNRLYSTRAITADMTVDEVIEVQTRLAAIDALLPLVEKATRVPVCRLRCGRSMAARVVMA